MFHPQPTPMVAAAATAATTAATFASVIPQHTNDNNFPSHISFPSSSAQQSNSPSLGLNSIASSNLATYSSAGLPASAPHPHHTFTSAPTISPSNHDSNDGFLASLNPIELAILGFNSDPSTDLGGSLSTDNGVAFPAARSSHHNQRLTVPRVASNRDTGSYRSAIRSLAKLPVTEVIGHRSGAVNGFESTYPSAGTKSASRILHKSPSVGNFSPSFSRHPFSGYIQPQQSTWITPATTSQSQSHQSLYHPVKMEDQDQHSLAAQEAAARAYEPNLEGPLVGNKQSSEAIAQQYAKADPVYVEKTMLLPRTYSHYRPIQGDGNCGWRAIGFLYCEKLIELGDKARIDSEAERHENMKPTLDDGSGFLEDFVDAMVNLLKAISDVLHDLHAAHRVLFEHFNDADLANPLVYYLRILAAHHLKANAAEYDAFVIGTGQGSGVVEFCQRNIEPVNMEIEQMGITALTHILLKPVHIVLEIAYLDRSPGTETNTYRYPDDAKGRDLLPHESLVCLLYRPDHYDVLYRAASYQSHVSAAPVSVQVHRVGGLSNNADIAPTHSSLGAFSNTDYSTLAMIPGMGPVDSPISMDSPAPGMSVGNSFVAPQLNQNQWMPFYEDGAIPTRPHPPPAVTTPTPPYQVLAIRPQPDPENLHSSRLDQEPNVHLIPRHEGTASPASECTIRFSPLQYQYRQEPYPEPTFQVTTNTFKNSVWNRAHFGNPDFHPEEYNPEEFPGEHRRKKN